MKPLTDTDPMPFGKWKDTPMQDVPAGYLHWLWNQDDFVKKGGSVCDYIASHLDALAQEYPDGVWGNKTKQQVRRPTAPEPVDPGPDTEDDVPF